jgi:hypothetical protein
MASSTRAFFSFISVSGRCADLDHRHAADQLAPAAPAVSRGRSRRCVSVDLGADLLDAALDVLRLAAASMIVGVVLVDRDLLRAARSSSFTFSSLMPRSSVIALPPVRIAMSSSMALRRSP